MSGLKVRVDSGNDEYVLVHTDGTFDFDGGSLIIWRDNTRTHLGAAFSPTGWESLTWEVD